MSALKKLRKENKKGFTLVELIVVLVILAILAAITVPALTKYIDKAKEKQLVIDGRSAYLACQTIASEKYATDAANVGTWQDSYTAEAAELASIDASSIVEVKLDSSNRVTDMTYTDGNKYAIFSATTGWIISDAPTASAATSTEE